MLVMMASSGEEICKVIRFGNYKWTIFMIREFVLVLVLIVLEHELIVGGTHQTILKEVNNINFRGLFLQG